MKQATLRFACPQHNARSLALEVLQECRHGDAFVQDVFDRLIQQHPLKPADRRLATQLAYGAIRRQGTLDALLHPLVSRQPHEVETWLWDALRLGTFQLALLSQIPPHAAIHETVALADLYRRPWPAELR